ncbi:hypothetical protein L249_8729 [Ophiocordyceps polyrhachis-furcata BCC 54312]|uniref:Carboxypeptidase n=1 Tax=Ophiocordyceps polyrhachis-furcata BCC 54312 TaxID=1330021 RepID=A0A367L711_9HYPO|nr:hypothetical protein L249_8729 [Ophiocordyceps polyrhachis-furcata BCC 54312]
MKSSFPLLAALLAGLGAAHGALSHYHLVHNRREAAAEDGAEHSGHVRRAGDDGPRFLNAASSEFAVNGSAIPEVDFDVGESYAGLLPISDRDDEQNSLYFWFFPTANEERREDKEIVIWMNGGPGCASLLGLLQENGPFLWQPGMLKPLRNPWSWHLLANVVYIDQPVTAGYSQGNSTVRNEDHVAEQFLGFWSNFIRTFGMQGWRVYVVGESYGGYYGPFIANGMLEANDEQLHGKLAGLMVYDGIMFDGMVQTAVVMEDFVDQHRELMPLDDQTMARMRNVSATCGFGDWHRRYLRFPAVPGPLPPAPGYHKMDNGSTMVPIPDCENIFSLIVDGMRVINPCFSVYNIREQCPKANDPLAGDRAYFDRADVKRAVNAPAEAPWRQCNTGIFNSSPTGSDESPPPDAYHLPNVVDQTKNVILAHGAMDFLLPLNGVLLGLQNMTWGGKRGFERAPSDPFYVPLYGYTGQAGVSFYGSKYPAGSGVLGTTHEERGLTLVVTQQAGHEGPEYAPAAALRQLEKLLGRVDSLSEKGTFTLPALRNVRQIQGELGKGTVKIPSFDRGC